MQRRRKSVMLVSPEELRRLHHLTVKQRHEFFTRLNHYLLAVHYLGRWLEIRWINAAEFRRLEKVLAKRYGLSENSILRTECRRRK